jgi:hypothetical protein
MSEAESSPAIPIDEAAARGRPIGSPRDFVLACIGLVSLLADELPALLERSVQQGGRVVERAQAEAKHRRAVVVEAAPQAVDEWQNELARRGIPSHRDFEALLQQLIELERQLDQLAAQRATRP